MSSAEVKVAKVFHSETFQVVGELEAQGKFFKKGHLGLMLTTRTVAPPPAVLRRLRENGVEI